MSASVEKQLVDHFQSLRIHKDAENSPLSRRLLSLFPASKVQIVDEKPLPQKYGSLSPDEFDHSKKSLYVEPFKGSFFKRCPGAKPGLVCCNYFVLNLGLQCHMNCSYCYLQSYLNTPVTTLFSNINQAFSELKEMADAHHDKRYRVGTGETIDSLGLDPLTHYSRELITFFREYPNWIVELKTKSHHVDQFLDVEHAGNVLVSWSLNPQYVIDKEEHGTASLKQRLDAAEKCLNKGFKVTFHFDPMIWHENWKDNYAELASEIQRRFSPGDIDILTVGALRFVPEQRLMMKERFGMKSLVNQAEVFPSQTGKLRYDGQLRKDMFSFMIQNFKSHSPKWRISLCMESPESWTMNMPDTPRKMSEIEEIFSPLPKSVKKSRPEERPTISQS